MIGLALALYARLPGDERIDHALRTNGKPFKAMSAYKGDEIKGERDWPWIIVGSKGDNCLGCFMFRDEAMELAEKMNGMEI
jgi:hypothetical protein